MNTSTPTLQQAYPLIVALVAALGVGDSAALQHLCAVSGAVSDEMLADVDDYFAPGSILSVAPLVPLIPLISLASALPLHAGGRPAIDSYVTHAGALGVECVLYADCRPSEAILHVEVSAQGGSLALYYKYIGS